MMSMKNAPPVSEDVVLSPKTKLRSPRKCHPSLEKMTTIAQFVREIARSEAREIVAKKALQDTIAAAVRRELDAQTSTIIGIAGESAERKARWMMEQQVKHMESVMQDVVRAEVARQLAVRDADA